MTTVQYVAATAFSLIVFVMMANFIVFLYARGVVRAAVDEGARAGGRFGATTGECESRARDVLGDLLAGQRSAGPCLGSCLPGNTARRTSRHPRRIRLGQEHTCCRLVEATAY